MVKIFISYSRKDNEFARKIALHLGEHGAEVWIDNTNIRAGMNWSTAIQQALEDCKVMILIVSQDSMSSLNVTEEWQYFHSHKKIIIPVQWKPAKIHFQLNPLQHVDFFEKDYSQAFERLLSELRSYGVNLRDKKSASVPYAEPILRRIETTPLGKPPRSPTSKVSIAIFVMAALLSVSILVLTLVPRLIFPNLPTATSMATITNTVFTTLTLPTMVNLQPTPPQSPCSIQQYTILPDSLIQSVGTILSLTAHGKCVGGVRASRFVIDGTPFGEDAGAKEQSESWTLTSGSHTICFEITVGEWSIGAQRCISVIGVMPTSLPPSPVATFVPLPSQVVITATRAVTPTNTASATNMPSPTFTHTVTATLEASNTPTYTLTASVTYTPVFALPPTASGIIRTVAYSPDGHYFAVAGDDGLVLLFDLKTGLAQTFNGFGGRVSSITFSPDGQTILAGSYDKTVKFCSVASASQNSSTCRLRYDSQQAVYSVAYSADGTRIVVGTVNGIHLLDSSGVLQAKFPPEFTSIANNVVFAENTHTVLFVGMDENVHVWDMDKNTESVLPINHAVNGKQNRVLVIAYNPKTQQIASGGRDGIVVIQDRVGKRAAHCASDFGNTVTSITFSPNGKLIAYASGEQVVVCDLSTGTIKRSLIPNMEEVNSLAYSPDGSLLLIGGMNLNKGGEEKGLMQRIPAPTP